MIDAVNINEFKYNIDLLLGTQLYTHYSIPANKYKHSQYPHKLHPINNFKTNLRRVSKESNGFNISSLKIKYTYCRNMSSINLRHVKSKPKGVSRIMVLSLLHFDKDNLLQQLDPICGANITDMTFTSVLTISETPIDEAIKITLLNRDLYLDYNDEGNVKQYVLTPNSFIITECYKVLKGKVPMKPFNGNVWSQQKPWQYSNLKYKD